MSSRDGDPDPRSGPIDALRWFLSTEHAGVSFVREVLSSAFIVLLLGFLLFGVSGVWPPMVAVESGSMEPHMERGDLVFVVDEQRFVDGNAYADTGVVPYQTGVESDYQKFGDYGDVIIYAPEGSGRAVPIIHRARFWVDEGENWYSQANPEFVQADSCEALQYCPAPTRASSRRATTTGTTTRPRTSAVPSSPPGSAGPPSSRSRGSATSASCSPTWPPPSCSSPSASPTASGRRAKFRVAPAGVGTGVPLEPRGSGAGSFGDAQPSQPPHSAVVVAGETKREPRVEWSDNRAVSCRSGPG
ncbi:S26 family signal peptidase [Halobacteriaceae archaeon GCM10025711]